MPALSTASLVLLGVIALGALVQAVFVIVLGRELLALGKRLDAFQATLLREYHPLVEEISKATRNLALASELTEQQARRIDSLVTSAVTKLVELEHVVEEVLLPPASRLAGWMSALRGLRGVFDFYRRVRG